MLVEKNKLLLLSLLLLLLGADKPVPWLIMSKGCIGLTYISNNPWKVWMPCWLLVNTLPSNKLLETVLIDIACTCLQCLPTMKSSFPLTRYNTPLLLIIPKFEESFCLYSLPKLSDTWSRFKKRKLGKRFYLVSQPVCYDEMKDILPKNAF